MKDDGTGRDESMFGMRKNDDPQASLAKTPPIFSPINIRSGPEVERH